MVIWFPFSEGIYFLVPLIKVETGGFGVRCSPREKKSPFIPLDKGDEDYFGLKTIDITLLKIYASEEVEKNISHRKWSRSGF